MDEIDEKQKKGKIDEKLKKGKKRLREARVSMRLTQAEMGIRVSVAKSTICRAESENDKYFLPKDVLEKYSMIFHKPLYFWNGEEPNDEIRRLEQQLYVLEKQFYALGAQAQKQLHLFKKNYQNSINDIRELKKELKKIKKKFAD